MELKLGEKEENIVQNVLNLTLKLVLNFLLHSCDFSRRPTYISSNENSSTDGLNNIHQNQTLNYLEINFSPSLFKQIFGQTISTSLHKFIQIEIVSPSMLHLAHLLQSEMEAPEILSQEYVLAIVTTMIATHKIAN